MKNSVLKQCRDDIMDHGIVHLVYRQNGMQDIINPFSLEGYEILSDGFLSFLEIYRPIIPPRVPIVLEIVGSSLSQKEKELIDTAIWTHFCLSMADADRQARRCMNTCFWFLLFTVLSTVLIFAVNSRTTEVVTNMAYLPFYFFGYRLLIYLLIDSMPLWKNRAWNRRIASLKLKFSGPVSVPFDKLNGDEILEEIKGYEKLAEKEVRNSNIVNQFLLEDGIVSLGFYVHSLEDIVQPSGIAGREHLTYELASYISMVEGFIKENSSIKMYIDGTRFTPAEKYSIREAFKHYYNYRLATTENNSSNNRNMIFHFGFFVIFSIFLLLTWGKIVDVALHEFIIMLFWFFGDYLLEFVLITRAENRHERKILEACKNMTFVFNGEEE